MSLFGEPTSSFGSTEPSLVSLDGNFLEQRCWWTAHPVWYKIQHN